jgi:hypothetical protein
MQINVIPLLFCPFFEWLEALHLVELCHIRPPFESTMSTLALYKANHELTGKSVTTLLTPSTRFNARSTEPEQPEQLISTVN